MGERRYESEAADRVGPIERESERDRAAQRVADHQWPVETQRLQGIADMRRLAAHCGAVDRIGIARPRTVDQDHAVIARQLVEQRIGEIAHLSGKPMDHHDHRAGPFVPVMDALAVYADELAIGGHRRFRPRTGQGGKTGKCGTSHKPGQQSAAADPLR